MCIFLVFFAMFVQNIGRDAGAGAVFVHGPPALGGRYVYKKRKKGPRALEREERFSEEIRFFSRFNRTVGQKDPVKLSQVGAELEQSCTGAETEVRRIVGIR